MFCLSAYNYTYFNLLNIVCNSKKLNSQRDLRTAGRVKFNDVLFNLHTSICILIYFLKKGFLHPKYSVRNLKSDFAFIINSSNPLLKRENFMVKSGTILDSIYILFLQ